MMKTSSSPTFKLDWQRLPRHVAVIMDGNGRWAQARGLPRIEGHREGMNSVRCLIETCGELGIPYLTLYAFSTENWKRPRHEIQFLMHLLIQYFKKELENLHRQGVRIRMLGRKQLVPPAVLRSIHQAMVLTRRNQKLQLNLAFNYGGRQEILDAIKHYLHLRRRPLLTEKNFAQWLYTHDLPDPDLLIRTSGEYRVSNFLLWQIAYTEMVISPVYWPEFRRAEFLRVLAEYQQRERRFGNVGRPHA